MIRIITVSLESANTPQEDSQQGRIELLRVGLLAGIKSKMTNFEF